MKYFLLILLIIGSVGLSGCGATNNQSVQQPVDSSAEEEFDQDSFDEADESEESGYYY